MLTYNYGLVGPLLRTFVFVATVGWPSGTAVVCCYAPQKYTVLDRQSKRTLVVTLIRGSQVVQTHISIQHKGNKRHTHSSIKTLSYTAKAIYVRLLEESDEHIREIDFSRFISYKQILLIEQYMEYVGLSDMCFLQ